MRPLMLAQITAIRTRELAESALMRFLPLVQRTDMRLQLRVRCGCVSAPVAHVRSLACMRALVVVLCLIRGECLVAAGVRAGVRPVACVPKQVT